MPLITRGFSRKRRGGREVGRWRGGDVERWRGGDVERWRGGEVGRRRYRKKAKLYAPTFPKNTVASQDPVAE